MRAPLLTILLLSLLIGGKAQSGDSLVQAVINRRCKTVHIELSPRNKKHDPPPFFSHIQVVDLRRDTSRLGLTIKEPNTQHQIRFRTSATAALTAHFNEGYTGPGGRNSLLIVVKNLWMSEPADTDWHKTRRTWSIDCRLEAYWQRPGGYIPLTWLDSTVYITGYTLSEGAEHLLPLLFSGFINKVLSVDFDQALERKRLITYSQIDSFAQTRYHFPMDTASRLVKGVYANLDEFRNNKPSIPDYQLTKDKQGILELQTPDGSGRFIYTHTVWGFCDGKQAFLMMDGNLFPVFTLQHQYYVLGSKEYVINPVYLPLFAPLGPAAFLTGALDVSQSATRWLRIFCLDLETGIVGR